MNWDYVKKFEPFCTLANWPATLAFARPWVVQGWALGQYRGVQTILDKQTDKWTDKQGWTNNFGQTNRQTKVDKQFLANKQTNGQMNSRMDSFSKF